jgi:hypothetical protein
MRLLLLTHALAVAVVRVSIAARVFLVVVHASQVVAHQSALACAREFVIRAAVFLAHLLEQLLIDHASNVSLMFLSLVIPVIVFRKG